MNKLEEMLRHLKDHGVAFSLCYDAKTKTYILVAYDYIAYGKPADGKQVPVPLWNDIYSETGELISHSANDYSAAF